MDKGFVLPFISKVQSIITEISRQQEPRHLVSLHPPSRNRTISMAAAQSHCAPYRTHFSAYRVQSPSHYFIEISILYCFFPYFLLFLKITVTKAIIHRYTWRPIFQVIIDFVKLKININHTRLSLSSKLGYIFLAFWDTQAIEILKYTGT